MKLLVKRLKLILNLNGFQLSNFICRNYKKFMDFFLMLIVESNIVSIKSRLLKSILY